MDNQAGDESDVTQVWKNPSVEYVFDEADRLVQVTASGSTVQYAYDFGPDEVSPSELMNFRFAGSLGSRQPDSADQGEEHDLVEGVMYVYRHHNGNEESLDITQEDRDGELSSPSDLCGPG